MLPAAAAVNQTTPPTEEPAGCVTRCSRKRRSAEERVASGRRAEPAHVEIVDAASGRREADVRIEACLLYTSDAADE